MSTLTTLRNLHVDCLDLREPETLIAFFGPLRDLTHLQHLGLDQSSWMTRPYPDWRPGKHSMTHEIAYISSQVCCHALCTRGFLLSVCVKDRKPKGISSHLGTHRTPNSMHTITTHRVPQSPLNSADHFAQALHTQVVSVLCLCGVP